MQSLVHNATAMRWGWRVTAASFLLSLVVILVAPLLQREYEQYYRAAVRVGNGETPYVVDDLGHWHTFRYPPAFAYLVLPFGQLDPVWGARLWFVMNLAALAGCCLLGAYLVLGPRVWSAEAGVLVLVALFACSCYNCGNLFQGQVALAMTLACLGWAACRRAGRNFTGGLLLAAACVLKLAPVVLLPYLVLRRDWRGLAGVAVGGVFVLLLPSPWVGFEGTVQIHRAWLDHLSATQVPFFNYRPGNQGLMGLLARLPWFSNGGFLYSSENLAALVKVFPLVVAGLGALLYAGIAWRTLRAPAAENPDAAARRENGDVALLLIFLTLANPCAWRCNFAAFLLPCMMLASHVYRRAPAAGHCARAVKLVALAWMWPVFIVANLVRSYFNGNTDSESLVRVVKGYEPDAEWWGVVWLLQGANFWVALYVGALCWSITRTGANRPEGEGHSAVAAEPRRTGGWWRLWPGRAAKQER
jgi:hypothetical protein